MKIRSIETYILRTPLGAKRFFSSQAAFPERNSFLVKITADNGLVGWGEGGQYGPPEPPMACVEKVLAPKLIGRQADEPVRIFEELYSFSRDFGQKGTYVEALSAIDIALWDLWGKSLGRPVHALLGGAFRTRVPAYGTGCYYPDHYRDTERMLRELAEEARGYREAGMTAIKMKIGLLPIDLDAQRLAVVREAIGPEIGLMVDANHAYTSASAIRIGRSLEKHNVLWFEEPVVPEDREGYRRVRDAIDVPVAGGECEYTRFGFRDLMLGQCIDIAQPDLCCAGGFTEWTKILALTSSFGVLTVPHVWGSGIAVAAALQAIAVAPQVPFTAAGVPLQNEPMIEFDRTHNPLRDDLLVERFVLQDGAIAVPTGPGLGVEVNEAELLKYSVKA
ncbi:mandelate racemase/muconate lactonizing enzyme family protein [Bosea rubneri]|uniref:Mandelate racemase/muconate lactonizing enzyme family protein n=1 Tax=Bosea rubneri TaxID=3075434 RepID=A0ABU3S968_9HYPH|nr:mandelate racemase/muconate lactonizing enzyme family protein [Bosea sp. ZW T0_25]MDU0341326.1 mandelate racemase/muconate lactonizing enzyme family protein [Bosea sp. ZW T0_25]